MEEFDGVNLKLKLGTFGAVVAAAVVETDWKTEVEVVVVAVVTDCGTKLLNSGFAAVVVATFVIAAVVVAGLKLNVGSPL